MAQPARQFASQFEGNPLPEELFTPIVDQGKSALFLGDAFRRAAAQCRIDTEDFRQKLETRDWVHPLPQWEPEKWPKHIYGEDYNQNNCYNFALNTKTNNAARPGMFSKEPFSRLQTRDIGELLALLHQGALDDGLIFLGNSFKGACERNLNPVALFMRGPLYPEYRADFHWLALRRKEDDVVWAQVPGYGQAAERVGFLKTIFHAAKKCQYNTFAGYYGVPAAQVFDPVHDDHNPLRVPQPR